MTPTLSVVVPALDEAAVIGDTLRALAPLRARGVEVLVVDGGSRDDTAAIAAPLADRVLVSARGRACQMNAGAAAARGEVLLFLHADTLLPPLADLTVQRALRASGRHWGRFDVRLSGRHPLFRVIERAMNLRSRLTGIATGDQAIFVRRSLFGAVGGYPPLPLMEDVALSARLRRHGPPACPRARVITASRRWERAGVLRTMVTMWWLRAAFALGMPMGRLVRAWQRL